MVSAAATPRPSEMHPANMMVPSKNARTSGTSAKGLMTPACPPAPAANQNQPVDTGLCCFSCMPDRRHIVKDEASIGVDPVDQVFQRPERGYDQRHFVSLADLQIGFQARVGVVDDQIDPVWRVIRRQSSFNLSQPGIKSFRCSLVKCRKAADNAGLA